MIKRGDKKKDYDPKSEDKDSNTGATAGAYVKDTTTHEVPTAPSRGTSISAHVARLRSAEYQIQGEISTKAILNVEADRLAGKYQDKLGAYNPITHMYPSSPTVFEINGMTITSNIQHQLIKAYAEPKYL